MKPPIKEQIKYLEVANKYIKNGKIDSIRLSTRPDYIYPKILKMRFELLKFKIGFYVFSVLNNF